MPDSSAIASIMMSRPSSLRPMVKTRTRGDEAASARQYAYALALSTNSPGAPGMRPRNFWGDTTVEDCGRYETQGERKCGSVVALAMASTESGSGVSGAYRFVEEGAARLCSSA